MGLALWLPGCTGGDDGPTAWDPALGDSGEASSGGGPGTAGADDLGDTGMLDDSTGGPGCTPGETIACTCPDGAMGEHVCNPEGDGFYPCECDDEGSTGQEPGSTGEEPPPDEDVVCYPGQSGDFTTCLPLHRFETMPAGYEYPPPYMGNANYRSPVALLDLEEVDPNTWLAPNFQLVEIAQLNKGRYAVVQPHAIVSLQGLRDQVGALGVNSGYRSPGYNAGIPGAATYSRHMYGDAYDLNPLAVSLATLENACVGQGGTLVEYGSHVHCDFRNTPVDEEFYGPVPALGDPEALRFDATLVLDDDGVWRTVAEEGFDEGEPLRRWTARDAAGQVIAEAIGPEFVAPPGTATVDVRVGAQVERSASVP